jgi:hypothetical protein
MSTGLARRIQWLFPPEREVYQTGGEGPLTAACVRCGAPVRRDRVVYRVRDRKTQWKNQEVGLIHRGCVPTKDFQTAGLPARRRVA